MALKIIQVMKWKAKQDHPNTTNHVAVTPKGQQGLPAGHAPGEEYLQTSQANAFVAVIPAVAYLLALSGLYALHIIEFLVKLLLFLASTMFYVLRFWDDG